ncbi:MAG: DUF3999 family protein [Desulfomonile tiedjei]|nr:DUF3999 family protein [Desulfomonile tiedjei]
MGALTMVAFLALTLPLPGLSASFDSSGWSKFREIHTGPTAPEGVAGFALESAVIANSKPDLSDLRVVDSLGDAIPITITELLGSVDPPPFDSLLYKVSRTPGKWTDLWIDKKGKIVTTGLSIQTSSKNFSRVVELRGSDNTQESYVIRMDGLIFDLRGPVPATSLDLSHPPNNFRYLHIRILDGDKAPLTVEGVQCLPPHPAVSLTRPLDLRVLENRKNNSDGSTVLIVDLGERRFPIAGLSLSTRTPEFVKKIRLLGSASDTADSWQPFFEGTVFRLRRNDASKEQLAVKFAPQLHRFIMAELTGGGSSVEVSALEAHAGVRLVIFERRAGETYRLLYDNPKAKPAAPAAPGSSINVSRVFAASSGIGLGHEQKNDAAASPIRRARPSERTAPTALWKTIGAGMLLVGLLMLFGAMLRARSARRTGRGRNARVIRTKL